jgi:glycosyltransferase involved in cell wall biosynthesis
MESGLEDARQRVASRRPRRILLLARGGAIDGSQRQVGYLVRELDRSRYEPVVLLDRPGPTTDFLRLFDVEPEVLSLRKWRGFPGAILRHVDAGRLCLLAERRGVELVHASDMWKAGYMHHVARRLGIPSVLHIRGPVAPRDIRKHRVARSSAVIAIAERYRRDLIDSGVPPMNVEVIDDAVDADFFRPAQAGTEFLKERYAANGGVLVGLVGRIEPFKRVLEFLEAIAPLARDKHRNATYLVIGRAKDEDYCQAVRDSVKRLGLAESVILTGHCAEMPQALSALDILVTMSGGSVMFEAMACAKCLLSVRTDGRHSVHTRHGETAWCVTTDSPGPAAEALAKLIDDGPLRLRLGQAARAWVACHLSPARMAEKTQAVYDRLIQP